MTIRSARRVQLATCQHFGIEHADLLGHSRFRTLVKARHIAMYLCRHRLHLSFPEIAFIFGNRDHTTVLAACRAIAERIELEPSVRESLASIEALLTEAA